MDVITAPPNLLHTWRRQHNYSIRDIADLAGLAPSTINRIENRQVTPGPRTKQRIARALEVPIAVIFPPPTDDELDIDGGDIHGRIADALEQIGTRARHRRTPLCTRCARHDQQGDNGLCGACERERHDREKERKRRWWAKHGQAWRDQQDTEP